MELVNIVVGGLKELRGKVVMTFNPSGSLDDTIEVCDYASVDSLINIIESMKED